MANLFSIYAIALREVPPFPLVGISFDTDKFIMEGTSRILQVLYGEALNAFMYCWFRVYR